MCLNRHERFLAYGNRWLLFQPRATTQGRTAAGCWLPLTVRCLGSLTTLRCSASGIKTTISCVIFDPENNRRDVFAQEVVCSIRVLSIRLPLSDTMHDISPRSEHMRWPSLGFATSFR